MRAFAVNMTIVDSWCVRQTFTYRLLSHPWCKLSLSTSSPVHPFTLKHQAHRSVPLRSSRHLFTYLHITLPPYELVPLQLLHTGRPSTYTRRITGLGLSPFTITPSVVCYPSVYPFCLYSFPFLSFLILYPLVRVTIEIAWRRLQHACPRISMTPGMVFRRDSRPSEHPRPQEE